jgi:4-amino-4-deoxy-L-arabinose transferase-like glycosyltransferase
MLRPLDNRAGHYALLGAVWALLCLPNLGGPSLWDIDEGNNAEAAHEMFCSGNLIVPTFNGVLREDKPALLYWLQGAAYGALGVNEFAARLPSALAALLAVLATYELGRRMFGKGAGLLAGLVLAGAALFCASAHFANPDALLNAFTALSMLFFWLAHTRGGRWLAAVGLTSGLAVLAKGPVGTVLPGAVALSFLLWRREPRRLWDVGWLWGSLAFLLVAAPWYVWVAVETKGQWLVGFLLRHNLQRAVGGQPMEGHGGPFWYYAPVLIAGLAPWSVFLGPACWYAWQCLRRRGAGDAPPAGDVRPALQFLVCWAGVYFVFFSVARTKLPNYVLPLYPAAALLTGYFLDHWRRGLLVLPAWVVRTCLLCLALMGVGVTVGLLVAGGVLDVAALRGRRLAGLERWAATGGVLLAGALAGGWCLRRGRRGGVIAAVAASAVLFTAPLTAWGVAAVDRYKAPRALAGALPADQQLRDVRVGAFNYFQPSLVFYCRREVVRLQNEMEVYDFLRDPLPSYLFVRAEVWRNFHAHVPLPVREVARHYDLYDHTEVVVVTNEK